MNLFFKFVLGYAFMVDRGKERACLHVCSHCGRAGLLELYCIVYMTFKTASTGNALIIMCIQ